MTMHARTVIQGKMKTVSQPAEYEECSCEQKNT